ncbi:hypothetical protein Bca4012_083465 [Brassica carinata]
MNRSETEANRQTAKATKPKRYRTSTLAEKATDAGRGNQEHEEETQKQERGRREKMMKNRTLSPVGETRNRKKKPRNKREEEERS